MSDNIVLNGSLDFLELADIFQILGGNNSTGVLNISRKYVPYNGIIYFLKGNPINSTCGSLNGIKSINTLFGWTDGQFEFHEEKVQIKAVIKKSRMEIVLDALRLLDDGEIERVGPPSFNDTNIENRNDYCQKKDLPVIKGPFVDYSYVVEEESYNEGAMIVKEKAHGKWISVIYEGTAIVRRDTINGPLDVALLGEGSFIGSFRALSFGEFQRNASVFAQSGVHLVTLNSQSIYNEYKSLSPDFQNLLVSLDNRLTRLTDSAVALYEQGDHNNKFTNGKKIIIKRSSSKKDLFVIREGNAGIVVHTPEGNLPILTLGKGEVFGENPFVNFGHEPQSASVLASNNLKVDKLDAKSLQEEYDMLSGIMKNWIYHVGNCITMTTRLVHQLHKR